MMQQQPIRKKTGPKKGSIQTPEHIAKLEIIQGVCPLVIKRNLPNNQLENWDINELKKDNLDLNEIDF